MPYKFQRGGRRITGSSPAVHVSPEIIAIRHLAATDAGYGSGRLDTSRVVCFNCEEVPRGASSQMAYRKVSDTEWVCRKSACRESL